jgi:hypothetical protein
MRSIKRDYLINAVKANERDLFESMSTFTQNERSLCDFEIM